MKKSSSLWMRASVLPAVALAAFVFASGSITAQQPAGGAQQPAAGAPQTGAPGPGAPGRGPGGPGGPGGGAAAPGGGGGGRAGGGRGGPPVDTLAAGPWEFAGGRGAGRYRVVALVRNLDTPWGIAFLPNGDLLVTERPGRLRVVRNGVLDPNPIANAPDAVGVGLGGMLDVTLHPNFAQNRYIYLSYSKADPDPAKCANRQKQCSATLAIARAKWDGGPALTDLKDILVTQGWHGGPGTDTRVGPATGSFGSRFAWDKNGLLYITSGDRNLPSIAQDPMSHNGKILRVRDDGSVPPDNPFVNNKAYLPEIYTLGHRNPLGLYFRANGELWSTEEGPQGGDELNLIEAGKNYGWPEVGLGRHYDGSPMAKGFSAPGYTDPVVFWVPAIANSGLSWYNGDKFPAWRDQAFVGGMRNNTGQFLVRITFNEKGLPTARENMLMDLKQRIREAKPGPDGLIYVLTDTNPGHILRIEPVDAPAGAAPAGGAPGGGGGRRGGGPGAN